MDPTEKQKIIVLAVLLAVVALLINYWQEALKPPERSVLIGQPSASSTSYSSAAPLRARGSSNPQLSDSEVPQYGALTISTDHITDINVSSGMSYEFSPVGNVAYDYYVDGRLQHHYPVYVPGSTPAPRANFPSSHKAGFRLTSEQGLSEIKFVYVFYFGQMPPDNWYAKALRAMGAKD